MSRYSQGVLARKLVNRSCSPGVVGRLGHDLSADVLQARPGPMSPRSSITILKPPAVPRPSSGGAPKTLIGPSVISRLQLRLASRAAIASPVSSGAGRWWKSSSITYMAPKFGALALSRIDWPAMATVCLTPGVSLGDRLDVAHGLLRCGRAKPSRAAAR